MRVTHKHSQLLVRCDILIYSIHLCVCVFKGGLNKALLSDGPHFTLMLPQQPGWDSSRVRVPGPPLHRCGCHCGNATAPLSTLRSSLLPPVENGAEEHLCPPGFCSEEVGTGPRARLLIFRFRFCFHVRLPGTTSKFSKGKFWLEPLSEDLKKQLEEELKLSSTNLKSHAWYHGPIPWEVCTHT